MFRPLGDRVCVKRLDPEEKIGSIIVPEGAKAKAQRGEVIAVGKGHLTPKGVLVAPDVNKGDQVLFGKYAGEDVRNGVKMGEDHLMLREDEILAVIEPSNEDPPGKGQAIAS